MQLSAFERRLEPDSERPVAVALSGGADSLLALSLTLTWAKARSRAVVALCVDHGLQRASAAWSDFAAGQARRMGAEAQILRWDGPKPETGLAAAARQARHRLLALAARRAGARVIVTGHTASDARENALMGQGAIAEWSPSPVWPCGRGVFLLRPLLHMSREAVREQLRAAGGDWIDDPANLDSRHPRVRARQSRDEAPSPAICPATALAGDVRFQAGAILVSRAQFDDAPRDERVRVLAAAATCQGGGERPAKRAGIERLVGRLAAEGGLSAALAGARIEANGQSIGVYRNAGEYGRRPPQQADGVWDGRYEVPDDMRLLPARGRLATVRAAVSGYHPLARGSLPLIGHGPDSLILAKDGEAGLRWLVPARFAGACGLIAREGDL